MPKHPDLKKVLILGSGPIIIGQAAEFDYSGAQACLSLREEGIETVLLNSNPATIMTDADIADHVYIEPMTLEVIEQILQKENVDGIIPTLGGQTGLNLGMKIAKAGLLEKYHTRLLGSSLETIFKAEDREAFRSLMHEINEPVALSEIVNNMEQAQIAKQKIGLPLIVRPAYTMGGSGGGIVFTDEDFESIVPRGLGASPINQVLLEQYIGGMKEVEYEVMRDSADNCITVCNMENFDPVGVHTGDSIVVAPSQTLSDKDYQMLRTASLKIIRALGVEGGCNIQFALDPDSYQYYVIEVNPRVSRSSALASKATGYPIARVAAKIAIGMTLDEIPNAITQKTVAAFEPALDYCVLKIPRFPFDKFPEGGRTLSSQMKATGEVMAIDRTFEGALKKALRSLDFKPDLQGMKDNPDYWVTPTDYRLQLLLEAMRDGLGVEEAFERTKIDRWFLRKLEKIVDMERQLKAMSRKSIKSKVESRDPVTLSLSKGDTREGMLRPQSSDVAQQAQHDNSDSQLFRRAKQMGFTTEEISALCEIPVGELRELLDQENIRPTYKMVDTCAGEFEAVTPYFYSTWEQENEAVPTDHPRKAIVIGSGPIRIGQGIEFDYCSVHAAMTLRKLGVEAIMVNNNPETVSTDFDISDRLYFEPLTAEDVGEIYYNESKVRKVESPKSVKSEGTEIVTLSLSKGAGERGMLRQAQHDSDSVIPAHAGIQSSAEGGATDPEQAVGSPGSRIGVRDDSGGDVRFIVQFGGQTSLSMASELARMGLIEKDGFVDRIELASNRDRFEKLLRELDIPYPDGEAVESIEDALKVADRIGYPVLVRPSFVLGGRAMQIVYDRARLEAYMAYVLRVSPDAPVLIDRYVTGKEVEVDLIYDGQEALIPGIMEHIERAGIHSGDSMAVYPPQGLTLEQIDLIVDYSLRLAKAIGNLGLNNIQYIVDGKQVYVIEANPRGSRTVPFLSKVTGVPMVELATRILYGEKLKNMGYLSGLYPETGVVAVKAPVFSFAKLDKVSTKLGPEMKSTGEVMGIDATYAGALFKAFEAAGMAVPTEGRILATIADSDKQEALSVIRGFAELGFEIVATRGTSGFLGEHGVPNERIEKIHDEGSQAILKAIKARELQLVINTPTDEQSAGEDGPLIRQTAIEYGIPCVTSLDTARALLYALRARRFGRATLVKRMGEWVG